jgi:hypothetical protein
MLWPLHYPTTSSTVVDRIASTLKRSHSFRYLGANSTEIFMSGASGTNDDMVVGRTNNSEDRTLLIATNGGNYEDGFVLSVSATDDTLLVANPNGVDGIHAKGTKLLATGGQTIRPGNGILGQGLNGVVGYVHAAARDHVVENGENGAGAGVVGIGGTTTMGVFGTGTNGIVGYEQTTPRDPAFEAQEMAGVLGRGQIGVSGDGVNGPGVHGRGLPGVQGDSSAGTGVLGQGVTGVVGEGHGGAGVQASSDTEQAAILESRLKAQVWLVPLRIKNPTLLPRSEAGEIVATIETLAWPDVPRDVPPMEIASLWFCKVGGSAGQANWIKLA